MTGLIAELIEDYRVRIERHRNRAFLRATMAACALAATADGEVSFGERIRVDRIIDTLDQLRVFDPHEAVDLFDAFSAAIIERPREGHQAAVEAVEAVTDRQPETAKLIVRICLAIAGPADRHGLAKDIEIVMLCSLLGVEPPASLRLVDGGEPPAQDAPEPDEG